MSKSKFKVIKVANVNEWFGITKDVGKSSVNSTPAFIEAISDVFQVQPFLTILYYDNKPLLGCVLYNKGNSIIHPFSNIYTALWINSSSVLLIQEAMLFWLTDLTKRFRRIEFNLPPEITDIRVFYKVGFRVYTFYTYINVLKNEIKVKSKIKNLLKRAQNQEIEFTWNDQSTDLIKQQKDSFKNLNYGKIYVNEIALLITKLSEIGALIPVSAREKNTGTLLASSFILSDYRNKHALNFLLTSDKKHYKTGVHSAIYYENLQFLKAEGYLLFDLCGATTLGVGNFKANFKGELTPYYIVKFSRLRWKVLLLIKGFKAHLASVRNNLLSNRRI